MELAEILAELRRQGNDTRGIEAKAAHTGYPQNTAETMSAFANTPGGGVLVLGLDEAQGFAPVGVYDPGQCQQAAIATARNALRPSLTVTTELLSEGGRPIVAVYVPEADHSEKPVRVAKTGRAYLRLYDGDYPLSEAEEQVLLAQRGQPRFDDQPVAAASAGDLDAAMVQAYVARRRESTRRLATASDTEVLVRTGVLAPDGQHPTLAGLLALGLYPQQFFPGLAVQASLHDESGVARALDSVYLTGPAPAMLGDCTAWVRRVTPTVIVAQEALGTVTNRPTYPPIVVRELVANALIHRDLSPASLNQPILVKLTRGEHMTVSNPGGLFGLSVEALGLAPPSARNARLCEILQFVDDPGGNRVVERLGSGIPEAQRALADAFMPPLRFDDQGIRFAVFVDAVVAPPDDRSHLGADAVELLRRMNGSPATIAQLAARTGRTTSQVRYLVAKLVQAGRLAREPLDGRTSVYRTIGSSAVG